MVSAPEPENYDNFFLFFFTPEIATMHSCQTEKHKRTTQIKRKITDKIEWYFVFRYAWQHWNLADIFEKYELNENEREKNENDS